MFVAKKKAAEKSLTKHLPYVASNDRVVISRRLKRSEKMFLILNKPLSHSQLQTIRIFYSTLHFSIVHHYLFVAQTNVSASSVYYYYPPALIHCYWLVTNMGGLDFDGGKFDILTITTCC